MRSLALTFSLAAACACFVALPAAAGAHAVITRSSIGDEPLAAGVATEVTLHFNSAIETSHSSVQLVGADGEKTPLALAAGAHEPGTLRVALPALEEGTYALHYRVLAADGHMTESVLRFRVVAGP
jgi:methionine-rich copper-binding protein CopC